MSDALPDFDAVVRLLGAVSVRWLLDARHDPVALADLAEWLQKPPELLQKAIEQRALNGKIKAGGERGSD